MPSLNCFASFLASSARYDGVHRLGGRLPSVRARSAPSAVATASFNAACACSVTGAPAMASVTARERGGGGLFLRLELVEA